MQILCPVDLRFAIICTLESQPTDNQHEVYTHLLYKRVTCDHCSLFCQTITEYTLCAPQNTHHHTTSDHKRGYSINYADKLNILLGLVNYKLQ